MKLRGRKIVIIMLTVLMMNSTIKVNAATYDVFTGGFASCKNLTWNTIDNKSSTEASTAISQWNNISSNVKIKKVSSLNANIIMSIGKQKPPKSGDLGLTLFYKSGNSVSTKSRWNKALCLRYATNGTKTNKYATSVHEVGHALSMAHCTAYNVHSFHIMHQGLKDSYKVTSYDKKKLKYKWGN